MTAMTMQERCDRLDAMIAEGRVIRGAWVKRDDGRERACLLATLSPECGASHSSSACPADVMPRWLAEMVPAIDDCGSIETWPAMVRRFAGLARRWHVLDDAAWQRLDFTARLIAIDEAERHYDRTSHGDVAKAVDGVRALLVRAIAGDVPTAEEWGAAREAAGAAASWAARAARAAWAAAWAAAAWDRMTAAIFDAIEKEITACEVRR